MAHIGLLMNTRMLLDGRNVRVNSGIGGMVQGVVERAEWWICLRCLIEASETGVMGFGSGLGVGLVVG